MNDLEPGPIDTSFGSGGCSFPTKVGRRPDKLAFTGSKPAYQCLQRFLHG